MWRSLGTDSLKIAVARARSVATEIEATFDRARRDEQVADHNGVALDGPDATRHWHRPPLSKARTIREVYRLYLDDPGHLRCHRTMESYDTTGRWIEAFFGADTPATSITRERCREFLTFLMAVPKNAHKKFPGLSIVEAVAHTASRADVARINAANVNAYLNKFSGALNWAEHEGLIPRNPARGLRIADPVKKRDKRRPFSTEQLRSIFTAPLYTGCEDDERGYPGHP